MEFDMKILSLLCLITCLTLAVSAEAKVYKWVDENGEVHYSESLPPDFEDNKADVLNNEGITQQKDLSLVPPPPPPPPPPGARETAPAELPRDSSGQKRPTPLYTREQIKQQQDSLLLLRYDSEQELLDAMQVEIKQLGYDVALLTGSRSSLMDAYRGNIREAADKQRAGMPVEPALIAQIDNLKQKLDSNWATLEELKAREAGIHQKFEADVTTYRRLSADAATEQR
jgi:Domain of unknown function (DUF4124)